MAIGAEVVRWLRNLRLEVIVFDPYLRPEQAVSLGVETVSLEEAFIRGGVVSNHLADFPQTRKMLTYRHFASMRRGAVFINTGRGATVDEIGMIEVLSQRPDITALLDTTAQEPPVAGSLLYALSNVHLSTHIAGSLGNEYGRLGEIVSEGVSVLENRCASEPQDRARHARYVGLSC